MSCRTDKRPGRIRTAQRLPSLLRSAAIPLVLAVLAGCAAGPDLPSASPSQQRAGGNAPYYHIGPGDALNIFVWENPELSVAIPVRPDGRISTPLVEDLRAAGRTPTELSRAIEDRLSKYIKNPVVSVMVTGFNGLPSEQIRVVGEAAEPQALPYRQGMTLLDVMISVGGLTEFAAGNDAVVVREIDGEDRRFDVRLDDLLRDGDITANVRMLPGDVLIIPESWF
jgi:polysaccharide export outer membrane protein